MSSKVVVGVVIFLILFLFKGYNSLFDSKVAILYIPDTKDVFEVTMKRSLSEDSYWSIINPYKARIYSVPSHVEYQGDLDLIKQKNKHILSEFRNKKMLPGLPLPEHAEWNLSIIDSGYNGDPTKLLPDNFQYVLSGSFLPIIAEEKWKHSWKINAVLTKISMKNDDGNASYQIEPKVISGLLMFNKGIY